MGHTKSHQSGNPVFILHSLVAGEEICSRDTQGPGKGGMGKVGARRRSKTRKGQSGEQQGTPGSLQERFRGGVKVGEVGGLLKEYLNSMLCMVVKP